MILTLLKLGAVGGKSSFCDHETSSLFAFWSKFVQYYFVGLGLRDSFAKNGQIFNSSGMSQSNTLSPSAEPSTAVWIGLKLIEGEEAPHNPTLQAYECYLVSYIIHHGDISR